MNQLLLLFSTIVDSHIFLPSQNDVDAGQAMVAHPPNRPLKLPVVSVGVSYI
jgi:hypothetical protein